MSPNSAKTNYVTSLDYKSKLNLECVYITPITLS